MKELPDLIDLYEHNKDKGVVVVGVNFEEISLQDLKRFVVEYDIPFPVLHSEPIPVTPLGRVPALPTTYIIDPNGKLVAGEIGIVTRQHLEDYIASKMDTGEYDSVPVVQKKKSVL
jgi:peroxiredoxin